ncbi:MAG: hypothetical protein ACLUI3_06570 [Christensenellales bacterium]
MDSEANIKGLTKLQELANEGLITFDASINGGEEIALFVNGTSQMAFCWNAAQVANNRISWRTASICSRWPSRPKTACRVWMAASGALPV